MRRIIGGLTAVLVLALFVMALQPHATTVQAACPQTPGECRTPHVEPTHQPRPTPTAIVVTATPVPVLNQCGFGFFLSPFNGCQPIVQQPTIICEAPNTLVPQASFNNGLYNQGSVYYVNGVPMLNGTPYYGLPGYNGYGGLNSFNGLGGYANNYNALACVPPVVAATPVPQPVIVQVQSPQAPAAQVQTVAPSLPALPTYRVAPPNTGDGGLAALN